MAELRQRVCQLDVEHVARGQPRFQSLEEVAAVLGCFHGYILSARGRSLHSSAVLLPGSMAIAVMAPPTSGSRKAECSRPASLALTRNRISSSSSSTESHA